MEIEVTKKLPHRIETSLVVREFRISRHTLLRWEERELIKPVGRKCKNGEKIYNTQDVIDIQASMV